MFCHGIKLGFILAILLLITQHSLALITGGEGNRPFFGDVEGQPKDAPPGVAQVANHPSRIAWWEGPPFGGGNFNFEYRGNAQTLAEVIARFAKVQSDQRYIVLHEGTASSVWLSVGGNKSSADLEVDWTFEFWLKDHEQYSHVVTSPDEPPNFHFAPRLHVYTGGSAKWEEIKVPDGITVVDTRLAAHGFTEADGAVAEGLITDLQTGQPIEGAEVLMEVQKPTEKDQYHYEPEKTVKTDAKGRWVFTQLPSGGCRFTASKDQFVKRFLGYGSGGTPRWNKINGGLSKPAPFSGTIVDTNGAAVPGAAVSLFWLTGPDGIYEENYKCTADEKGHFVFDQVPPGSTRCGVQKEGYCMVDNMAIKVTVPTSDLKITLIPSASLKVKVNFKNGRPKGEYRVGLYKKLNYQIDSHDAIVDVNNIADLKVVLPGDYFVIGNPNPTTEKEKSEPVPVSLKPGEHKEIEIEAK